MYEERVSSMRDVYCTESIRDQDNKPLLHQSRDIGV